MKTVVDVLNTLKEENNKDKAIILLDNLVRGYAYVDAYTDNITYEEGVDDILDNPDGSISGLTNLLLQKAGFTVVLANVEDIKQTLEDVEYKEGVLEVQLHKVIQSEEFTQDAAEKLIANLLEGETHVDVETNVLFVCDGQELQSYDTVRSVHGIGDDEFATLLDEEGEDKISMKMYSAWRIFVGILK